MDITKPSMLRKPSVAKMLMVLRDAGRVDEARFVGGCVRNILMGLPINDIDIATTMLPQEVTDIFTKAGFNVHPTGIEHGTVTVVVDREPFEFTTLRRDVETDGRRATIAFTKDWKEDAYRRDFCFNAIYMDANGDLHDPTERGIDDAIYRILSFVGDAEMRIREDSLRILRMFRFAATLGAKFDAEALAACEKLKADIETLSGERIEKEVEKIMSSANPRASVEIMCQTGMLPFIFQADTVDLDALDRVCQVSGDWVVRTATMVNDPDACDRMVARWSSSNDVRRTFRETAWVSMDRHDLETLAVNKSITAVHNGMAFTWAHECEPDFSVFDFSEMKANIRDHQFPLRGADLIEMGVKPGKQMGEILAKTKAWWIENRFPSDIREFVEETIRG